MCGNICKLLFHKGLVSKHRKNSYNSNIKRANSLNKLFFKVKVKWLSHVPLFVTPWTVAYRLLRPRDFPGKSTGVGAISFQEHIQMVNKHMTYKELPLTPPGTATVKSSDANKGLTDQGTATPHPHAGEELKQGASLGNSMVEPQEEKGKSHQRRVSNKNPFMDIFISIIQDNQTMERIQISPAGEQRSTQWSIHAVQRCSATERNETQYTLQHRWA